MISNILTSDERSWETPPAFMEFLREQTGCNPSLDVAASSSNAKAPAFFDKSDDGLIQDWSGIVWMNPPFGRELPLWVDKAVEEYTFGNVEQIWILVPARTDTAWFNRLWDFAARVWLVKGRLNFIHPLHGRSKGTRNSSTFPSAVILLEARIKRQRPDVDYLTPTLAERGYERPGDNRSPDI